LTPCSSVGTTTSPLQGGASSPLLLCIGLTCVSLSVFQSSCAVRHAFAGLEQEAAPVACREVLQSLSSFVRARQFGPNDQYFK
jgi:hypothetical protein